MVLKFMQLHCSEKGVRPSGTVLIKKLNVRGIRSGSHSLVVKVPISQALGINCKCWMQLNVSHPTMWIK